MVFHTSAINSPNPCIYFYIISQSEIIVDSEYAKKQKYAKDQEFANLHAAIK